MQVKTPGKMTFRDRLSRLSPLQAEKLLGPEGARMILRGGHREVVIEDQVHLDSDTFRLVLPDAVVTIQHDPSARECLRPRCNRCDAVCEHVGAAFALVLEEKTALGLAAPPPERTRALTWGLTARRPRAPKPCRTGWP